MPTSNHAYARLRTPQARVMAALIIEGMDLSAEHECPLVTRAQLHVKAGYTAVSGSITRALNGIKPGSSSGNPQIGLLAMKMVEEVVLDIEGVKEINYRATAKGVAAYKEFVRSHGGRLPKHRPIDISTNNRYKKQPSGTS